MTEVEDQLSFENLKKVAMHAGLFCDVHKGFRAELSRPGREAACFYLSYSKKYHPEMTSRELQILNFCTAAEVYDKILALKKESANEAQ